MKFSHRAANTREEAEALAGLVSSRGWKRVLVVTSNYHARRARFIFGRVFPAGVSVRVSGAHDSEFDPVAAGGKRAWGEKLFLSELLGYVVAWWELRSETPRPPGAVLCYLDITPVAFRQPHLIRTSRN